MKKTRFYVMFVIIAVIAILGAFWTNTEVTVETAEALMAQLDTADIAWMLAATCLVLFMTPGLAFFYGGMVSYKNMISTMIQSFICLGVISLVWLAFGFSMAFGDTMGITIGGETYGIVGNPMTYFMFDGVGALPHAEIAPTIPFVLFAMFQLKFAIITPALITGSFAERVRFSSYILFITIWSIIIYTPLAHMTWHPEGLLMKLGVLDFAGGTVVHMSAGFAAVAGAMFFGRRDVHKRKETHTASNIPYVILGTGMLWFGWFGFNAGSSLGANDLAATAFANTNTASATAMITWIVFDAIQGRKTSALGACIGAVVGLVAITPAAGFVEIGHSVFIGFAAALVSNLAVSFKNKSQLDDTLDVFPCHGIGGIVGMLLTAVFAVEGGMIHGEFYLIGMHLITLVGVAIFTFGGSYLLYIIVDKIIPLRVRPEQEEIGLDIDQHGEQVFSPPPQAL